MDTKKIKIRMLELGLSVNDIAKMLGYTNCWISQILNHPKRSEKTYSKIINVIHDIEKSKTTI